MNICIVTPFFHPSIGGIENHVLNLANVLQSNGNKVFILTSNLAQKGLRFKPNTQFKIKYLKTLYFMGFPFKSLSSYGCILSSKQEIKDFLLKNDIDIVHIHGHHYPISIVVSDITFELGIASVLTLHGMYALDPLNNMAKYIENIYNKTLFKKMLKNINCIIGLTKTITHYAELYGPSEDKYYTIPNGINLSEFKNRLGNSNKYRQVYNLPLGVPIVLYRGRHSNVKSSLEYSQAVERIITDELDVHFVFVGDGPEKHTIEKKLKRHNSKVSFFNWFPYDDIPNMYIASDYFVLPSKWEALPITILESMASNNYIISTKVGGIPDVLKDYKNKTWIDSTSPTDIYVALKQSLENSYIKEEYEGINNYDWSYVVKQIERVYYLNVK